MTELVGHQGDVSAADRGRGGWESWESGAQCQFDSLALVAEFLVADVPS